MTSKQWLGVVLLMLAALILYVLCLLIFGSEDWKLMALFFLGLGALFTCGTIGGLLIQNGGEGKP